MNREDVYKLIDGERDYQDSLGANRTDGRQHSVGEYLVMLDTYLRRAFDAWTGNPGDSAALDEVRKIAGIAVHCMEDYDTPSRKSK